MELKLAQEISLEEFESFALKAGCKYLEVGGPTSRLEEKIENLSETLNFRTEVFATPSAIIISAQNNQRRLLTSLNRIRESSIDLNLLFRIDRLFDDLVKKRIELPEASIYLDQIHNMKYLYPSVLIWITSFIIGFTASYAQFQSSLAAFLSGAFSLILVAIIQPLFELLAFTRIFYVFFGSLLAMAASVGGHVAFGLSVDSLFLGSLIVLVPGLMITTAVSELAEHNFVSGTVKLINGILILVSIGTALFIGKDSIQFFTSQPIPLDFNYIESPFQSISSHLIITFILTLCFCFKFQTPKRFLFFAVVTGLVGQLGFEIFRGSSGYALPTFVAAFLVGLVSLSFARFFKAPSQIFSVPGIVSMVPGVLSFTIYNSTSLVGTQELSDLGDSTVLKVAVISSSLVFGLIMSRFPFRVYRKTRGFPLLPTD